MVNRPQLCSANSVGGTQLPSDKQITSHRRQLNGTREAATQLAFLTIHCLVLLPPPSGSICNYPSSQSTFDAYDDRLTQTILISLVSPNTSFIFLVSYLAVRRLQVTSMSLKFVGPFYPACLPCSTLFLKSTPKDGLSMRPLP